jgi:sortase A
MARHLLLFVLRWLERAMFLAGVACVAWVFLTWKEASFYQLYARTELRELIDAARGPDDEGTSAPPALRLIETVIGQLDVPRLDFSVVAVEGDGDSALRLAAGHLPDTPLPWQPGNASFAGHRDTFFRALRKLRVGDDLTLTTTHGTFRYRVARTLVVEPSDLSVLDPENGTALTLITCYPFTYLGDAPQRFIVQAERVDPSEAAVP